MLKLYNTLTRKKEFFKPLNAKNVKMYTCGPTVYDYAHIGNFRAYLFEDLLRRYLKFLGFKITQVMNITDVDDKTIKRSIKEGIKLEDLTKKFTDAFFQDLQTLRIEKAEHYPKATEHISEMLDMIQSLVEKGVAYQGQDESIYFDISKFGNYGKLSKLKIKELKDGARVSHDEYKKDEARDFALWKSHIKADGEVFWTAPVGKGRPGWHIECSAMSIKYLGETFDIHAGGTDLMFPHHENEIAQSETYTGKKFVNYWLHNEHLMVNNKKMSKSLKNFYTLRDLTEKGFDPLAFRYLCFSVHYRTQMNFTFAALEKAKKTVDNINNFVEKVSDEIKTSRAKPNIDIISLVDETKIQFLKYMDDDLNTPEALAIFFKMIKGINKAIDNKTADKESLQKVYDFVMEVNQIFDIIKKVEISIEDKRLIQEREEARKKKDFKKADHIREILKKRGILLDDTPHGVKWSK